GGQLGRALHTGDDLEDAAIADLEREQVQLARAWPASAATVLAFVLRRRGEARAIRRAIWQGGHGSEVAA
ncbi:MAG TPA: hypothetical protein VFU21_11390, partial [Kofleriaceae bacterium]|nr:hypothetical protein [Kofleriaceae bacterium]